MEHDSLGYVPALKFLAEKFNVEWPQQEFVNVDEEKKQRDEKESLQILNNWANDYFQDILLNNEIGQAIGLSYFEDRGFRNDTIKKFNLGYSLDSWSAFYDKAIANQFSEELLFSSGLVKHKEDGKKFDAYRGRVIFPIHNLNGKVIAFAGRYLKKEPNSPKYVNSPETLLYHKSNELYGLYYGKNEIRKQDAVYLVEGYTDVISMHQSGVENVVASSGTSLTEGQIRLIKRFTENVTVLELAERIKGIVTDAEIEQTEISFQDARNYRVSSDAARAELGFAPKWTIEDGVKQVADAIWNKRIKDVSNPRFNNSESLRMQWGVRK